MDAPSIGMIPSGYKDGKLYSVYPLEGLGEELIINGDFSSSDISMIIGAGTQSVDNGKLKVEESGLGYSQVQYAGILDSSKIYKATFDIIVGTGSLGIYNTTEGFVSIQSSGTYTFYLKNTSMFYVGSNGVGDVWYLDNVSVKEDTSADFDFTRGSLATRVNAQGLVEDVNIISEELTQNGNFDEIGSEEVSNGDFSQEGSELIVNGDFSSDTWWLKSSTNVNISNGKGNFTAGTTEYFYKPNTLTIGKTYKVTFEITDYSTGYITSFGGSFGAAAFGVGAYIRYYTAVDTTFGLVGNTFVGSIDNVSVVEVGQDWSFANGASIGDDVATIVGDGSVAGYILQNNVFESNKLYKCVFDVTINSGLGLKFQDGLSYNPHNESIGFATTSGVHTFYFNSSTYSQLVISRRTGGTAYDSTINSISIKEVGQNWTFGTGWSMGDGKAVFDTDDGDGTFQSTDILTLNNTYRITFDVNITDGVLRFESGAGNNFLVSSSGTYTHEFEADLLAVKFRRNSTPTRGYIDNISVKEITDATDLPRLNYDDITWQDTYGSELVTNGGFDANSNWGFVGSSEISEGYGVFPDTTSSFIYQTDVVDASIKQYKIQYEVIESNGGALKLFGGDSAFGNIDLDSAVGTHTVYLESNGTGRYLQFFNSSSFIGSIDNVSVKEITGQEVASSGCPSLLLEPQSTNLVKSSEDFASANWVGFNYTITSNYATSPDGSNNASRYVGSTTNQDFYTAVTVTSDYTYSCYVKAINAPFIRLRTTNGSCWFDMGNKTVGTNTFTGDANIEDAGNDWYRLSVTTSHTINSINAYIHAHATDNTTSELDGCEFLLWGAQLEALPYATSYIPTNGTVQTRLADSASRSGLQDHINSSEGVLYAEISALDNDGTFRAISLSDGTSSNRLWIYYTVGANLIQVFDGSSIMPHTIDVTNSIKVAAVYDSNGTRMWVNGSQVGSNSYVGFSGFDRLNFSTESGSNKFTGKVKDVRVYTTALSDEDLQYLTS